MNTETSKLEEKSKAYVSGFLFDALSSAVRFQTKGAELIVEFTTEAECLRTQVGVAYVLAHNARAREIKNERRQNKPSAQPKTSPEPKPEPPHCQLIKPRKTFLDIKIPMKTRAELDKWAKDNHESMGAIVRRILCYEVRRRNPDVPPMNYSNTQTVRTNVCVSPKLKEALCRHAKIAKMPVCDYAGRIVYHHTITLGA